MDTVTEARLAIAKNIKELRHADPATLLKYIKSLRSKYDELTLSTAKAGRFLLLRLSSVGCSQPF